MGDLRNKFMKQAREAAHREFMARRYPPKPAPQPTRCLCGLTHFEVPRMWSIDEPGWPRKTGIYCPACIPAHLIHLVAIDAANTPE